nr:immunoglobulin heavy chain junction region [Mus musculus]
CARVATVPWFAYW